MLERLSPYLAPLATLAVFLAGVAFTTFVDPDMYHGLALARESLAEGHLLTDDVFAYTPTVSPVVHHEWALGYILYGITLAGGDSGILIARYCILAGTVGCTIMSARRCGAKTGVLCALAFISMYMGWIGCATIRANMMTMLFLAIQLVLLESDRRGGRWWIAIWLLLFPLWVNMHGGFVVGIGIMGLHTLEQMARRAPVKHLFVVAACTGALTALNPFGIDLPIYMVHALTLDRSVITEWAPVWQAGAVTIGVYSMSLVVVAYAIYRNGFRSVVGLILVLATAFVAMRSQRHLSLYAIVWLGYMAPAIQKTQLGQALESWLTSKRRLALVIWGVVLVVGCVGIVRHRPWHLPVPANAGESRIDALPLYPAGAVEYLRDIDFAGNVLTPFTLGAYLSWELYPKVLVSMDGRYEAAYPFGALHEHIQLYTAQPGWEAILAKYPTDLALISVGAPLHESIQQISGWTRVYQDDAYSLFARDRIDLPPKDNRGVKLIGTFP